jgi:imidazolonepropionase-like amidohydrolase/predicted methyltransferase
MEGGRVTSVGIGSDFHPRSGDVVVDVSGRWVVPGYIDAHVHLFDSGSLYTSPDDYDLTRFVPHERERRRIENEIEKTLDRFLCAGVTTVASLGGPRWELDLKTRSVSPRVVAAGPFLAAFPIGDMTLWTPEDPVLVHVGTPEDSRLRVREIFESGAGLVKAGYAGSSAPEVAPVLSALVDEAHARGLRVAMHAEEVESAKVGLGTGVDVLAHTVLDSPLDEETLSLARERGVVSITGLSHFGSYRAVLEANVELLPIEARCGDPEAIVTWDDLTRIPADERPEMSASIRRGGSPEGRAVLFSNARRLHHAGVPLAVGTNGGNVGTLQGPSFHREIAMLAETGMPLGDVLVAATRNGARALGLQEETGTIERGKAADVLVLSRNPLESVEGFAAIERVFASGKDVTPVRRAPAAPMSYRGAYWLEREEREDEERPERVLDVMGLRPGDVVADVGAGSGYYARRIAKRVLPGGKVYASDIQSEMLVLLSQLAAEEGIRAIETIQGTSTDPRLPEGALDWILLADVYHEMEYFELMLVRMRDALAAGGRVALVEYRKEDDSAADIKPEHRMSVSEVRAEWEPAGFELEALYEFLPSQHLFVFRRKAAQSTGASPP